MGGVGVIIAIAFTVCKFSDVLWNVLSVFCWIVIAQYCISGKSNESHKRLLIILRKMSIIIYFTHFAFVTFARQLHSKEIIGLETGMPVFICTIIVCLLSSYFIVRLSSKYKFFRYLY